MPLCCVGYHHKVAYMTLITRDWCNLAVVAEIPSENKATYLSLLYQRAWSGYLNPTFRRIRFLHYTFNGRSSSNTSADRFVQLMILETSSLQKSIASCVENFVISCFNLDLEGRRRSKSCTAVSESIVVLALWHNDTVPCPVR